MKDESCIDPKASPRDSSAVTNEIETASGVIGVDSVKILFAKIIRDNAEPVVIRVLTLIASELATDNIFPVSEIAECNDCSVMFNPDANITLTSPDGETIQIHVPRKDRLYPFTVEPLTPHEMDTWRDKFDDSDQLQARTLSSLMNATRASPCIACSSKCTTCTARRPFALGRANTASAEPRTSRNKDVVPGAKDRFYDNLDDLETAMIAEETDDEEEIEEEGNYPSKKDPPAAPSPAIVSNGDERDNVRAPPRTSAPTPSNGPMPDGPMPEGYRELHELHLRLGHAPADRILEAVNQGGLIVLNSAEARKRLNTQARLAREIIRGCPACKQASKNASRRSKGKTASDVKPFTTLHFDLIPMPRVTNPEHLPLDTLMPSLINNHILLAIDEATRYCIAVAVRTKKAEDIAAAFCRIDTYIREIMTKALTINETVATRLGYSWDAVRDRGKCIFRLFHADAGEEFISNTLRYLQGMPADSALGAYRQPYIVREGPYREGGAPMSTTASPDRKYENGLVERHHQTLEHKALAMLAQAGAGTTSFELAYLQAVEVKNVLPTDIPVFGSQEKRRGIPFVEAMGVPYNDSNRPLHAFGALAYPKHRVVAKHNFPRGVGIFVGNMPYPSREMKVTALVNGIITYKVVGPETTVSNAHFTATSAVQRAMTLQDRGYHEAVKRQAAPMEKDAKKRRTAPITGVTEAAPSPDFRRGDDQPSGGAGHTSATNEDEEDYWAFMRRSPSPTSSRSSSSGPPSLIPASTNSSSSGPPSLISANTDSDTESALTAISTDSESDDEDDDDDGNNGTDTTSSKTDNTSSDNNTGDDNNIDGNDADGGNDTGDSQSPPSANNNTSSPSSRTTSQQRLLLTGPSIQTPRSRMQTRSMAKVIPSSTRILTRATANAIRPGDGAARKSVEDFTDEEWDRARLKEYNGMIKHKVWKPAVLPPRSRTLSTKEVLKVRNDNSLKVRLTARGFMQRQNADYYETYSAVATHSTIRFVVALAAIFGLDLMTADVEQAYLQADMKEEIYLEIPKCLRSSPQMEGANCLRLLKGLYGTKQAGRGWYEKLKAAIIAAGLEESPEDPCLYFQRDSSGAITLALCTVVDDFLGAGTQEAWKEFILKLESNGILLDKASVGVAREFNGMRIIRKGLHHYELDQEHYLAELERNYGKTHSWRRKEKVDSPLGPTLDKGLTQRTTSVLESGSKDVAKLTKAEKADLEMEKDAKKKKTFSLRFMSLLGSLIWPAQITRPDIAFAVAASGEHSQDPKTRHLAALERTLSYALATKHKCLVFDCSTCPRQMDLAVFSDSDFASDENTRKSRSGIWIGINECPIFWSSKKQTVITDSTTAAETIAAHSALRQCRQIIGNMRAMGFSPTYSPLFCDNMAMLKRMTNDRACDGFGAKNLSVSTKMLQEAITQNHKDAWPFFVDTNSNVADIFTKGHLAGANAEEKWATLERRSRGDPPNRGWISDLVWTTRPKPDHRGRAVLAMERVQPITDLKVYKRLSSWGTIYKQHFPAYTGRGQRIVADTARADPPVTADATREMRRTGDHSADPARDDTTITAKALTTTLGLKTDVDGKVLLTEPLRILEVFSGPNKSASSAIREIVSNPELLHIITVDVNEEYDPTICVDVLKWNPSSAFYRRTVHFAWFSPPCPEYSVAKTTGSRDLRAADMTAKAVLRLIRQIQPVAWVIENPTGLLRQRPFMKGLTEFLQPTTYCMFNGYEYRKETDIYTNIPCPLPHCRLTPCKNKKNTGRHPSTAQRGPSANGTRGNSLEKLHRVPPGLPQRLFLFAHRGGDTVPKDTSAHPSFKHT